MRRGTRVYDQGKITWKDAAPPGTPGFQPAIAVTATDGGLTVAEVHQGQNATGAQWMRMGSFDDEGSVTWRSNKRYDDGGHPAIALDGTSGKGVEIHEGRAGLGPLWGHDLDVY